MRSRAVHPARRVRASDWPRRRPQRITCEPRDAKSLLPSPVPSAPAAPRPPRGPVAQRPRGPEATPPMGYDEALEREKKRWARQISPFRRVPQRPRHARAADFPSIPNFVRPPVRPLPFPFPSSLSSTTSQQPDLVRALGSREAAPCAIALFFSSFLEPNPHTSFLVARLRRLRRVNAPPLLLHSKPNTATSVLTGRCDPRSIKLASSRPLQSRA